MLTKEFWQDVFQLFPVDPSLTIDRIHLAFMEVLLHGRQGGDIGVICTKLQQVGVFRRASGTPLMSAATCGIGELGMLYGCGDDPDTLRKKVLYSLLHFLTLKRNLITFYMPQGIGGNYTDIKTVLERYGFNLSKTFYNHNSGHTVDQFENLLGTWSDYDFKPEV